MPKFAKTFPGGRRYRNPNRHDDNFVYRSVTTVTGALPKEALLTWYAKITAETAVEHPELWINIETIEEKKQFLQSSPTRARDKGGARGTTVHAVIDNMLQGRSYEVEAEVQPWLASVAKFVQEAQPEPERTETTTYDERTLCAGTFDFLGRLRSAPELGRCLIDWKTSKRVYPDQQVQLVGGYLYGSEYILDDDGHEHEWQEPDSALLVQFSQDGYAIHHVPKDRILRRAFLGALEIRKWEQDGPKVEQPYQLRLDVGPEIGRKPSAQEIEYVRSRLRQLDTEKQMHLNQQWKGEMGKSTKMSDLSCADVDQLLGLISLYLMGEVSSSPRMRPMP